jgi:NAD(P)H-nitrite reductase large subunit
MKEFDHIIVGASQAGLTAAQTLRENRPQESLLIINGEDRLPYKRTELTKKLAAGFEREEFTLFPPSWYEEQKIQRIDSPALSLDPTEKKILLSSGETVKGRKILLATGALPLIPDIPGSKEILHLRAAYETEEIRKRLLKADSVLIIGQGVEGVEMAEQCRLMGLDVVSTSTSNRLMNRWLDEELSNRLEKLLISQGIKIRYKEKPIDLSRKKENFYLTLAGNGKREILESQIVLASTGITGCISLLTPHNTDGLLGPRGVLTDKYMQTLFPGIYAAGDMVQMPPGWASGLWHSAQKQGYTAALNMAGIITERQNTPVRLKCEVFGAFFFSMAYDRVLGEPSGSLNEWILNREDSYVRVFFKEGKALGALMEGLKVKAKELASLVEKGADKSAFTDLLT